MTSQVITAEEDLSMMKASRMMKEHSIKHLPVMRDDRLVGIVSDRDLKEAQPSDATSLDIHEMYYLLEKVKIKSLMSTNPHTTTAKEVVERAAAQMLKYDISALPVVDRQGKLDGIVSKGDLFRAMIAISGIHQAQLQIGLEVEDQPGSVKKVTDMVRTHGGRIVSITTHHEDAPLGFLHLYIRCRAVEDEEALMQEFEQKFKTLYLTHYKVD
jgi:acetoin utilization protein AcuB